MEKETKAILIKVKNGELTINQGQRQLFVLFDKARSSHCVLDRLPTDCCICTSNSIEYCEGYCGHFQK